MLRVLIALKEDVKPVASLLDGHEADVFDFDAALLEKITGSAYDLVILEDGVDAVADVKAADPRADVILVGRDKDAAIEALRRGAAAYLTRPIDRDRLIGVVSEIDEFVAAKRDTAELEKQLIERYTFAGVVGRNPLMLEIFSFLRRIAPYYRIVTITGETGSGKEEIAKALHSIGPEGQKPFLPCNCGGLVESLIESEFFGHRKGSFTGAISDKAGVFEAAGEGTVFLDEVGDLPLSFQPHLLRVLSNGEFRRVGSSVPLKARCRVIAATNRDLSSDVASGRFREDLYFRLTPLTVNVPPLRDRKDDISLLCRFLLKKFCQRTGKKVLGISRPAQTALLSYQWPGNVRELESVIEQSAMLTPNTFIKPEDLPSHILKESGGRAGLPMTIDEVEKKHVEEVLKGCGGNRTNAARVLGISRRSLLRRLDKYKTPRPAAGAHLPKTHSSN